MVSYTISAVYGSLAIYWSISSIRSIFLVMTGSSTGCDSSDFSPSSLTISSGFFYWFSVSSTFSRDDSSVTPGFWYCCVAILSYWCCASGPSSGPYSLSSSRFVISDGISWVAFRLDLADFYSYSPLNVTIDSVFSDGNSPVGERSLWSFPI